MGRMQEKGLTAFWEFLLKNVEKSLFSLTVFANLKCSLGFEYASEIFADSYS